eukprot:238542_1
MKKNTNLKTNAVQQTSLPNTPLTSIPSSLTEINDQLVSKNITLGTPLLNKISTLDENLNIFQNNQTLLTNIPDFDTDININELNFEELYAQHHCMNSEPVQLTPQQYEEIVIDNGNHTPVIKNILREFFTNKNNKQIVL